MRVSNVANQKFSLLTVIFHDGGRKCDCLCDCGKTCIANVYDLKSGHKKSCGCLSHRIGSNSPLWDGFGDISGNIWYSIERHAKSRNLLFDITKKDAWNQFEKQNKSCALTGIELNFGKNGKEHKSSLTTASLDRIDSSKGYTKDNIWWIHKKLNIMKCNTPLVDFISYINLVVNPDKSKYELIIPTKYPNRRKWSGCELLSGAYFYHLRDDANSMGRSFDLTIKELWDLFVRQTGRCRFTNLPLKLVQCYTHDYKEQTASVDRIDSLLDYKIENVQWVHKDINRMKWDMSDFEFIDWCCKIHAYNTMQIS